MTEEAPHSSHFIVSEVIRNDKFCYPHFADLDAKGKLCLSLGQEAVLKNWQVGQGLTCPAESPPANVLLPLCVFVTLLHQL